MPTYIPQYVPSGLDAFTTGYLEAIEWLVNDDDRKNLRGFNPHTVKEVKQDCEQFMRENHDALVRYNTAGRNMRLAGHDFWLSRNGHAEGFNTRGKHPVFGELHAAAKLKGELNIFVDANGQILIE